MSKNHLNKIKTLVQQMRNDRSDITGFEFSYFGKKYDTVCEVDPNILDMVKKNPYLQYFKMLLIFFKSSGKPLQLMANSRELVSMAGYKNDATKEIKQFFNISPNKYDQFNIYNFYDALNDSICYYRKYPSRRLSHRIINTINKRYPKDVNKKYCYKMGNNGFHRSKENTDKAKVYCNYAYEYLIKRAHNKAPRVSFFFSCDSKKQKDPHEIVHNAINNHNIDWT